MCGLVSLLMLSEAWLRETRCGRLSLWVEKLVWQYSGFSLGYFFVLTDHLFNWPDLYSAEVTNSSVKLLKSRFMILTFLFNISNEWLNTVIDVLSPPPIHHFLLLSLLLKCFLIIVVSWKVALMQYSGEKRVIYKTSCEKSAQDVVNWSAKTFPCWENESVEPCRFKQRL